MALAAHTPELSKRTSWIACYSPLKNGKGHEILSGAIREPAGWWDAALLIPHEPIRRMLGEAELHIPMIKGGQSWKVTSFYAWFDKTFYPFVHHHHQAEETIYFPWLATRSTVPAKATADHHTLFNQLHSIQDFRQTMLDGVTTAAAGEKVQVVSELLGKWLALKDMMVEHLDEEEVFASAALKQHFTLEEEGATVQKILQGAGIGGAKLMLPIILSAMRRWGGATMVQEFRAQIPPPLLFFNDHFWTATFHRAQTQLQSLASSVPPRRTYFSCLAASAKSDLCVASAS